MPGPSEVQVWKAKREVVAQVERGLASELESLQKIEVSVTEQCLRDTWGLNLVWKGWVTVLKGKDRVWREQVWEVVGRIEVERCGGKVWVQMRWWS